MKLDVTISFEETRYYEVEVPDDFDVSDYDETELLVQIERQDDDVELIEVNHSSWVVDHLSVTEAEAVVK